MATPEDFTTEDLQEALRAIASTISKCEKVEPKLKRGTPQRTLLTRRIKALQVATALIERELRAAASSTEPSRPRPDPAMPRRRSR